MTAAARRRIRRFSAGLWGVATASVVVVALIAVPAQLTVDRRTGAVHVGGAGAPERPWTVAHPRRFPIVDGQVDGTDSGWIPVPDGGAPVTLRVLSVADADPGWRYLTPYVGTTPDARAAADDPTTPRYLDLLGNLDEEVVAVPPLRDAAVWIGATGDWRLSVTPTVTTPLRTSVEGTGHARLLYRGTAGHARVQHEGKGYFRVRVTTESGMGEPLIQMDETSMTVTWPSAPVALIDVDSGGGRWSVSIPKTSDTKTEEGS